MGKTVTFTKQRFFSKSIFFSCNSKKNNCKGLKFSPNTVAITRRDANFKPFWLVQNLSDYFLTSKYSDNSNISDY